ncbi:MAG: hypothetical protein MZV64_07625 [Ignavibacteriales bacterium]|nr:hypothetical protein [Ignavibacteriales bacterium]
MLPVQQNQAEFLKLIGLTDEQALSSVRFGFGRFNTKEEIEYASQRIIDAVNKLRTLKQINHKTIKQIVKQL